MGNRISGWSARGWERLQGDRPSTIALRDRVLSWLQEVREPYRTQWGKRLQSNDDPPFFSVVLELFLHHWFASRDWDIAIEPELPGTRNHPDFLVRRGESGAIVEAKVLFDAENEAEQDARLMQLADDVGRKIGCTVHVHPLRQLPPSLPYKRIAAKIESNAHGTEPVREFVISDEHQGYAYELEVRVLDLLGDEPAPTGVGVIMGQAALSTTGSRLRKAIQEKAGKYGVMNTPFVIAVGSAGFDYVQEQDDWNALLGDRRGEVNQRTEEVVESYSNNGIFTEMKDGKYRWNHASAVVTCRLRDPESTPSVYHNPHATFPLTDELFEGWQQHWLA